MKEALRFISVSVMILGCLVFGRYAWTKYITGQEGATLGQAVQQTKKDLTDIADRINSQAEKVLGEKTGGKPLENYLKEDLPKEVQAELQRNETIKEIQREVTTVINNTTEKIKELPQSEAEKLKKEIKEEICREVLK